VIFCGSLLIGAVVEALLTRVPPLQIILASRSARPLIVFSTMALVFVALWLVPALAAGQRPVDYSVPLLMVGLFAAIAALVYSTRVTVTDHGLIIRTWYVVRHSIPFGEVGHSKVQYLAEADWPVALTIYGHGSRAVLGRIALKAVRKEDAKWICSLPQLKPEIHPGLTKARV
jgi:hypothetical protein